MNIKGFREALRRTDEVSTTPPNPHDLYHSAVSQCEQEGVNICPQIILLEKLSPPPDQCLIRSLFILEVTVLLP